MTGALKQVAVAVAIAALLGLGSKVLSHDTELAVTKSTMAEIRDDVKEIKRLLRARGAR